MEEDWQNSSGSLKKRNLYLLRNRLRTDCRFLVGTEPEKQKLIEAHKLIVCAASPVFERMFYGSIPENSENAIVIDDIEEDVFNDMLHFIYTDDINIRSTENAQKLYYVANKYMIEQCKTMCITYLSLNLNSKNVCEIYEFAKCCEEYDLEKECLELIINNTSEVIKSDSFLESDPTTLDTILSQEKLKIYSELELFNAVENYAMHRYFPDQLTAIKCADGQLSECESKLENFNRKPTEQEQSNEFLDFAKIVKKIRFLLMSPEQFASGPVFSKLLTPNDARNILACLVLPKNLYYSFPSDFSNSKILRSFTSSKNQMFDFNSFQNLSPQNQYQQSFLMGHRIESNLRNSLYTLNLNNL